MSSAQEHKAKVSLASRLRTPQELRQRVSIWDTKAWDKRREARTGIVRKTRTVDLASLMRKDAKPNQPQQSVLKKVGNLFKRSNKASMPQKIV